MSDNLYCIAGSKILGITLLTMSLVDRVATDALKRDWSSLTPAEIDSLSKRIGKAMEDLFINPDVHKTRKLGLRHQQKKYNVGLMLIRLCTAPD